MNAVEGTRFRIIDVSGEAHDRGFQYGSKCRDTLSRFVPIWYSVYQNLNMSKEEVTREAKKLFACIENYSPEIGDEMRGTAEGAGVKLEEIVMITAFAEMFYPKAFCAAGCTSFAVNGNASSDGLSYVGQTNDESESLWMNGESFVLVLFRRPSGPNVLTYTYLGAPVDLGMNSDGIALCSQAVTCEDVRLGVPKMIVCRELLHQRTLTDAIGSAITAKRATSFNFLVADGNGETCDIEGTPSQIDYFYFKETFVHTNHFLSNKLMLKRDLGLETQPDTLTRYVRMRKLLETNQGMINMDKLVKFTKDHVNYPDSICRHPDTRDPPEKRWRTFDSIIMSPQKKELWIARGNPCKSKYEKYSVM